MKICFLGDVGSIHFLRWIRFFADIGHDVSVITIYDRKEFDPTDFPSIKFHFIEPLKFAGRRLNRLTAILFFRKVMRVAKEIDPDLFHAHNFTVYGSLVSFLGFKPTIVSAWGSDVLFPDRKSMILEFFLRRVLKKATLFHCDGVKTSIALQKYGCPQEKIKIIYFGTDTRQFDPKLRGDKIRNQIGIKDELIVLNLRGLLYELYGAEILVRAIPYVLKEYPAVKFVFAGEGPLKEKFTEIGKAKGFADNMVFPGFLALSDLASLMASSDIYVSTSLSDAGLAASTAEAMASELPVVVTDDPDNLIWIRENENGFIFPPGDSEKLAEKIIILAKNKSLRENFGRQNRKIIEERNNFDKEMSKMEKVYSDVIA